MLPVLGIFLALCGASLLALAMVTQRYALSYATNNVPFFGLLLSRDIVWFVGLVIYGAANGFYAASLLHGPLSLLAGVFTTLLVFNMLFSWYLLGETLTASRIIGSILILVGVVLCILGTPSNIDTKFTPGDIASLASSAGGALYLVVLVLAVGASVVSIIWYESMYGKDNTDGDSAAVTATVGVEMTGVVGLSENIPVSVELGSGPDPDPDPLGGEAAAPPTWLDDIMGVLYPGSLGMDEGIAHLTMKATLSMLDTCGGEAQCDLFIIYVFMVVWVVASIATLWWLRRVFARYESTRALPVEYGAVNIVSVCSGLLFFRESDSMARWQVGLVVTGVAVIACGIGIGRMSFRTPACQI